VSNKNPRELLEFLLSNFYPILAAKHSGLARGAGKLWYTRRLAGICLSWTECLKISHIEWEF